MKNTKTKYFVIVDKSTREVVACISDSGCDDILKNNLELKVYDGTEPVFTETDSGILLNDNAFTVRL